MSSAKRQSLLAWVAGVVLFSILCAHAISPDPGNLSESVSRGPLLAQAAVRPVFGLSAAAFAGRPAPAFRPAGSVVAPHPSLKVTPIPRAAARRSALVVPIPKVTPAYRYTFQVLSKHREVTDRYDEIILENSLRYGLDPRLIKAIIAAESEFSTNALSPRDARGLMQILPSSAEEMGVPGADLFQPEANIRAGTAYLAVLYSAAWKQYRLKGVPYRKAPLWVMERIIAAYNAGPRALKRDSFMRQTRNYVRKVLLFYRSEVTEFRRGPLRTAQAPGSRRLPRVDTLP